ARRPTVRMAARVGVCEDIFTPHLVIQKVEAPRRLLLGLHVERSLELPNLFRSCQAHANLLFSARSSAPRTRAPFLTRYYPGSPVVSAPPTPVGPASRGNVAALAAQTGLPCCKSPRVRTCCAHYPGKQSDPHLSVIRSPSAAFVLLWGTRRSHWVFRGLFGLHSRCGPYA